MVDLRHPLRTISWFGGCARTEVAVSMIQADPTVQFLDGPGRGPVARLRPLVLRHPHHASFSIDSPSVERALDATVAHGTIREVCSHVWAVRADRPDAVRTVTKQYDVIPRETDLQGRVRHIPTARDDVPALRIGRGIRRFTRRSKLGLFERLHYALRRARKK
jgi:hypothetical protein